MLRGAIGADTIEETRSIVPDHVRIDPTKCEVR
jgi:hypothetical protein